MELSSRGGSFICLHLDLNSWLGFTYNQFFISLAFNLYLYIIIKMPRTKQSPKKNLRDALNPTNWASNLRNRHCKYFYLIYALGCDRMVIFCSWMGIFCSQMGLSHHNLSTYALYFICYYYYSTQLCARMDTCCCRMVTVCAQMQIHVISLISHFSCF